MPLYDYDCAACGRRFEVIHGVHADPPASCPLCGSGPVRKAISAPTVHFKGSGWAKKERRAAVKTGAPSGHGDEDSADKGSDKGSSTDSGSSSDAAGASTATVTSDGDSSAGPAKPSKSDAPSKAPTKTPD